MSWFGLDLSELLDISVVDESKPMPHAGRAIYAWLATLVMIPLLLTNLVLILDTETTTPTGIQIDEHVESTAVTFS